MKSTPVERNCPGHGSRTKLSQQYPKRFCIRLTDAILNQIRPARQPRTSAVQTHFVRSLLRTFSLKESEEIALWVQNQEEHACAESEVQALDPEQSRKPFAVQDEETKELMTRAEGMPRGTEIHMSIDSPPNVKDLTTLIRRLRGIFLPRYTYEHAAVLRGTTGDRMPLGAIVDDGVALMWKKQDADKRIWIGPVSGIKSTFDPTGFTIVLLWSASYIEAPRVKQIIPRPLTSTPRPPPPSNDDDNDPSWDIADDESMPRAPSEGPFDMNVDDDSMPHDSSSDSDGPLFPPRGGPPGYPPGPPRVRISVPIVDPDERLDHSHGPSFPPYPPHGGPRDTHMPEPLVHTPPTPTPASPEKRTRWDEFTSTVTSTGNTSEKNGE